jgi:hypothetical protein
MFRTATKLYRGDIIESARERSDEDRERSDEDGKIVTSVNHKCYQRYP